jgi:uncharacterized protein (DUF488 family)
VATIFTIGHSTRTLEELIAILRAHAVAAIADVRLIPRSRRYPHFNDDHLARELPKHDIAYLPFKSLGGRKRPHKDSINTAWRNDSFRGYADFMQTEDFEAALKDLMGKAHEQPTAIMCAEAVPWRCHRSLISDALIVRGWRVVDIYDEKKASDHELTDFAKVEGERITYPPQEPELF